MRKQNQGSVRTPLAREVSETQISPVRGGHSFILKEVPPFGAKCL